MIDDAIDWGDPFTIPPKPFTPSTQYYPAMDELIILTEDVSHRSQWCSDLPIEILWHPYEDRIVGMKFTSVSRTPGGREALKRLGIAAAIKP